MNLKHILIASTLITQSFIFGQNYKVEQITIEPELIGNHYKSDKNKNTIALIIPGSGPTDRNGNQGTMKNNSLKFLAEGLAQNNLNVLTYDKRVVYMIHHYKNENKELPILDFQHGINDVNTIVNYLKNKLGYKKVVIIGHSEGSLIGMIAANKKAEAFISIAGSGQPIDEILKEQINKQAPMLNEASDKILAELKQGKTVKDVNPFLQTLYAEHNQPYLIEWIALNPSQEVKKLNIPILLINGDKDIQVDVKNAEALKNAKSEAEIVIINNMNHLLKEIKNDSEQLKSYNDPDLILHPELVPTILDFLKTNKL